jgi:ectoine hydroxylase-related dioxygenase (phytanoyl-CoA dioxygenase family)
MWRMLLQSGGNVNEHERYLFDLHGYLVVPNALSPETVAQLNATMDEHIAGEMGPDMLRHYFGHILKWGTGFRDLIDNPRIISYVEELVGPQCRLDHEFGDVIRPGIGPLGTMLHGGGTPYDPAQYYHFQDGHMANGLIVVAYNLMDVHPGDGGFGCVPGSHKSNYPFPTEWQPLDEPHPCVQRVTGPAGTAIIFTEALTHGTLPWTGAGERRTLFYKYGPHALSWSANYYNADDYEGLSDRQRAILEAPNARYKNRFMQ